MEQYKDAGKIKDLAMSNFTIEHIKHLFNNCKHRPSLNQFEIHPLYFDTELIDFCKKNSIVI
jgi:diketogulonate reductase-like aldo/keto reductase